MFNPIVENKEILKTEKERIKQKNEERLKKLESELESQFEAEFPSKLESIIEKREKELKVKYRRQLEVDRRSYESKAKSNLETKLAKDQKKLDDERTELARQKSAHSVALHQFEQRKRQMAERLRCRELSLLKKQAEARHEFRHVAPEGCSESFANCTRRELSAKPSFSPPEEANKSAILSSNSGLLPFSKALANRSINEMGNETLAPFKVRTERDTFTEHELYSNKIFQ